MNIVCLEVDKESQDMGSFLEKIWPGKIQRIPCRSKKDITREELLTSLKAFEHLEGKVLTVYGSGSFHHYTYGLCRHVADKRSNNYTYVHVDQHSDTATADPKYIKELDCASFVGPIAVDTHATAVKYIGCPTYEAPSVQIEELEREGVDESLSVYFHRAPRDIYVSLDLDVLKNTDMRTGWPCDGLSMDTFLATLQWLSRERNIISADALGYDVTRKPLSFDLKKDWHTISGLVYAMIAGTLLGEDITAMKTEHERLTKVK